MLILLKQLYILLNIPQYEGKIMLTKQWRVSICWKHLPHIPLEEGYIHIQDSRLDQFYYHIRNKFRTKEDTLLHEIYKR